MNRYSPKQLATAFYELLSEKPTARKEIVSRFAVFLKKMGAARLLNEIGRHFEKIRRQKENAIKVEIVTAQKSQPIFPTKINGKKVELAWQTDPALIAGSIIRIGDLRID
ncbi:MAG: F0F1 ATP synthase subunit delta, partial [Patescibacteria group bacterium]